MNQPDHVTSLIAIKVYKVILKLLTKMDFLYQIDVKKNEYPEIFVVNLTIVFYCYTDQKMFG